MPQKEPAGPGGVAIQALHTRVRPVIEEITMRDIPNPAAVPGIMPSEIAGGRDDLPVEADPHFGNEDSDDGEKPAADAHDKSPIAPDDR